ncbi:MAG TPA: type 1 glutamine amidotransferase domain-containing protein [Telluria sp.]|nr:type 1 glutamine amidotransferase domain-containing protein [Telluria sp.]
MDANTPSQRLAGKRVAVLMTDGVEQVEYVKPREFLEQHGAIVTLISPKNAGEHVQAVRQSEPGDSFRVDLDIREAKEEDYDALLLPGGAANPERLRRSPEALRFIKAFADELKMIAAICHGPALLIDAGVARAKHLTSWPSLHRALEEAGAEWSDEEVVIDGRLITSRNPGDIPAFNDAILKSLEIDPEVADTGPSS